MLGLGPDSSIQQQIAINRARTPSQRFLALCDLLESERAMKPNDEAARKRYQRVRELRQREREKFHAEWRRLFAVKRANLAEGI